MAWEDHSAIGNRVEKCFAKIEGGVHPDGKPQASRSSQSETQYQTTKPDACDADPGLSRISEMHGAEGQRSRQRGEPEAKTLRQCKLRVRAECKLFEQPDHDKKRQPKGQPLEKLSAVNFNGAEMVVAQGRKCTEHSGD